MEGCAACEKMESIQAHFEAIFKFMEAHAFEDDPDRVQIYNNLAEVRMDIHQEMEYGNA